MLCVGECPMATAAGTDSVKIESLSWREMIEKQEVKNGAFAA